MPAVTTGSFRRASSRKGLERHVIRPTSQVLEEFGSAPSAITLLVQHFWL
jgi:hypothetical protein